MQYVSACVLRAAMAHIVASSLAIVVLTVIHRLAISALGRARRCAVVPHARHRHELWHCFVHFVGRRRIVDHIHFDQDQSPAGEDIKMPLLNPFGIKSC